MTRLSLLLSVLALFVLPGLASAEERWQTLPEPAPMPKADESGYAPVNGIEMYYAVFGKGDPVLLIHGGLGHADMGRVRTHPGGQRRGEGVDLHVGGSDGGGAGLTRQPRPRRRCHGRAQLADRRAPPAGHRLHGGGIHTQRLHDRKSIQNAAPRKSPGPPTH